MKGIQALSSACLSLGSGRPVRALPRFGVHIVLKAAPGYVLDSDERQLCRLLSLCKAGYEVYRWYIVA
jgi:hypothetical protein